MAQVLRRSGVVLAVVVGLAAGACTSSDEPEALAMLSVVDTRIVAQGAGSDEVIEAVDGHAVDVGDRLETNETGYGELDYVDGSQTRLGPETAFTVLELAEGEATTVRSRLDLGRTWNNVQELGAQDRFEIETSVAVASVRGTLFAVVCSDLGCDFVVLEGTVIVTLPDGTQIELNAGDALHVGPDGVVGDVLEVDRFLLLPSELRGGRGGGSATGGGGTGTGGDASDGDDPDAVSGGGVEVLGSAAGGGDEAFARTTIAWIGRNLERDTSTARIARLDDEVLLRLLRAGVERRILEPLSSTGGLPGDLSGGGTTGGETTGGETSGGDTSGGDGDGGATEGGDEPSAGTTAGTTDGTSGGTTGLPVATTGGTAGGTTGVTPVTDTNTPPVAAPDVASTVAGSTIVVSVLANDVDADGDSITLIGASADVGTAIANVDGTVSYSAPSGFTGTAVVTYTIRDARGATASGALTVTVTAPVVTNTPPVALADVTATTAGTPVTIDVLANDTDADGDPLTVTAVGTPTSGTAASGAGGTITYSPGPFTGTATFTYTVSDGRGGSASALVTVTVAPPPNTPPVAVADTATTTSGTPVTVSVLANDTDADGDTLSVTAGSPSNGTAVVNTNQTVTYTSTAGFVGTATFTYTVSDGQGGTASATVTVTVTAPNIAPVALPDAGTVAAGSSVDIDVLANDTDADGDTLSISGIGTPTTGTAVLNTLGTITFTAPSTAAGTATFSYTASDGEGGTATALVTVVITAVNQPPAPTADLVWTLQGAAIAVDVLADDTDPDADALTLQSVSTAANGTSALVGGKVQYTPNPAFVGSEVLTYTVSDGTDTATTSVTVDVVSLTSLPDVGWSSDRTAPAGYVDTDTGTSDVYTMSADGTNVVKWTDYTSAGFHTSDLAWSRDGQQLTFTGTATRQIFVADASVTPPADNSGNYPNPTAMNAGVPQSADSSSWSPDGLLVAFNYHDGIDWEIYTAATDGSGSPTPVTALDATAEAKPAWSPDGDRIVMTSGTSLGFEPTFIEVAAPGNTLGQPVGTVLATYILPLAGNSPVYTADGTGIVYADSVGNLQLLTRSDSTVIPLLADGRYNYSPDVSPDGRWVVYVSETTSTTNDWDLFAIALVPGATPTPVALTSDGLATRDLSPAWRPGSANAAPTVTSESVYMLETSTIYVDVLANDSDPDADALTFTAGTPANGTASVTTTAELTGPVLAYTPTPGFVGVDAVPYTVSDGNGGSTTASVSVEVVDRSTMGQLAFSTRPSTQFELRLVTLDGTGLTSVTTAGEGSFIDADWSPAGDQLLVKSTGSGHTVRMDTSGNLLATYSTISGGVGRARWSPDGTEFVFERFNFPGSTAHEIWTSDLAAATLTQITSGGFRHNPDWSPDGLRFAVEQSGQLRELDTTGTLVQTLTAGGAHDLSYAPTGGRIAYAWMTSGGIRVVDTSTATIQNVFASSTASMDNTTWSPDERWVAFTMNAGSSSADIWVAAVQPNAVNAVEVIDTGARDEYPTWRP